MALDAPAYGPPAPSAVVPPDLGRPDRARFDLARLDLAGLRAMDRDQLVDLAAAIRQFLVSTLSVTGGHLGSNLGVVELTLAVHRVFRSPEDPIVWDTGHQAYVHKLVTGRHDAFAGLRQAGGLSGYPNRVESEHDLVENSHASTALSYAFGLARARAVTGRPGPVVAVVGDGALTGGLAYEALNNIGASGVPVVIVLNDNGRSYAPTISALAGRPDRAAAFFGALGIDYRGPVDGHHVPELEAALSAAARTPGPAVVHVQTVKGRGYRPAEDDEEKCLHDVGPFDVATGARRPPAGASYTEAFAAALVAEAAARPEVVAVTAAMGGPTGLSAFARRFPDRYIDVGIAEAHAVTAAAGLAMAGLRPVVAIYSTFLNRAWDQVYYDVGLHRLPVVFCLDRAGVTGDDGPSHHGLLDLALMTKVPGMTVLAPSSFDDVGPMLGAALAVDTGPVAIRWPKTVARRATPGSGLRARRLRAGADVCLIGVGKLVAACLEAATALEAAGRGASVWDARVVSPPDPAMLADAGRHRLVVVAEDGVAEGGAGALVAARLAAQAPDTRVVVAGVPMVHVPHGPADQLLAGFGLDGPGLAATVLGVRPAD